MKNNNVKIEIRAAEGGLDARIFAVDLAKMYYAWGQKVG